MDLFCGIIVGLALFLGLPISIIWLIIRLIKKKSLRPLIISICSFMGLIVVFSFLGATAFRKEDNYQEYLTAEQNRQSQSEKERVDLEEKEKAKIAQQNKEKAEKEAAEKEKAEKEVSEKEKAEKNGNPAKSNRTDESTKSAKGEVSSTIVYSTYLANNWAEFDNKFITVSFQVYNSNDDESYIQYTPSGAHIIYVYPDNYKPIKQNEYITVTGQVNTESNNLVNAHIDSIGDIAKQNYESARANYEQTFRAECEEVTYEDLLRYPDTYKDKKIKLTAYIKEIEPDGWILQGTIWAIMQENELVLYDAREIREPRLAGVCESFSVKRDFQGLL